MARTLALLAATLVLALACSGWRGPPRVVSLDPLPGPCGRWIVAIAAEDLRGQSVELRVDGEVVSRWDDVWGDLQRVVDGQGRPFAELTFEVAVLDTPSRASERVAMLGGHIAVRAEPSRIVAQEGRPAELALVVHSFQCPVDDLRWTASTGSWSASGPVTGERTTIPVPPHAPGTHLVTFEVSNDRVRDVSDATLIVGDPGLVDVDGDGYPAGADCDDDDPAVHPGAAERPDPNGRDDDCDGRVDEGTVVFDDDGDGLSEVQGDCNDLDAATFPGAREIANCRDDDCDGSVDEDVAFRPWPDDAFERPDGPYRITERTRRLELALPLVSRDLHDEERVEFWSQDGDWDSWGIDVVARRLPADSAFAVQIRRFDGAVVAAGTLARDGELVRAEGRAFRDDSGVYEVIVRPVRLHADGCPVELYVESR